MTYEQLMVKLFKFSSPTYYKWKKHENRPIFDLLEYSFSKADLEEWIEKKTISKFEFLKEQEANSLYTGLKYLNIFLKNFGGIGDIIHEAFMDFYFNMLVYAKNHMNEQTVFEPFSIHKSSLLYILNQSLNNKSQAKSFLEYFIQKNKSDRDINELIPKFEAGIERLDHFDCYTNQFIQSNMLQEFTPMRLLAQHPSLDLKEKTEAYLHILLFQIYDLHLDKSQQEKKAILVGIIEGLSLYNRQEEKSSHKDYTQPILIATEHISINSLLEQNLDIVEQNLDNIFQIIKDTPEK